MQIKDVMIHEVTMVRPEDPLRDAAQKMKALAVDPLPVWNGCELVGMLTRERITQQAARAGLSAGMKPVREAMIPEVLAAFEDEEVEVAVERLNGERGQELPGLIVLNRSRHLVGIVSRGDLERRSTPARSQVGGSPESNSPRADVDRDPVDLQSESSYPASDPPAPPSSLAPTDAD